MLSNPRQAFIVQAQRTTKTALKFLDHDWFDGSFRECGTYGERAMVLLLLNVYHSMDRGAPLNKTGAMSKIRAKNGRTSESYIAKAVRLGLVREKPSGRDKRSVLLFPTARLERMIEDEMSKLT